jgi:hypothetical protein
MEVVNSVNVRQFLSRNMGILGQSLESTGPKKGEMALEAELGALLLEIRRLQLSLPPLFLSVFPSVRGLSCISGDLAQWWISDLNHLPP